MTNPTFLISALVLMGFVKPAYAEVCSDLYVRISEVASYGFASPNEVDFMNCQRVRIEGEVSNVLQTLRLVTERKNELVQRGVGEEEAENLTLLAQTKYSECLVGLAENGQTWGRVFLETSNRIQEDAGSFPERIAAHYFDDALDSYCDTFERRPSTSPKGFVRGGW